MADLVKITVTENGPLTAKLGLTVETLGPGEELPAAARAG